MKKVFILFVVACVFAGMLFKYARRYEYDFTRFLCIGEEFLIKEAVEPDTFYLKSSKGYDSQFYYYMAQDLLIKTDVYKQFGDPTLRYQRIMYPFLAAILTFGNTHLLPFTLLLVNFIFILVGTWFLIAMLEEQNMNVWFALFYCLMSGLLMTFLRNLAAPVAMTFMLATFYFYSHRKIFLSAIFLSCAVLTREIFILLIPVLFIDSLFLKRDQKAVLLTLLPVVPFAAWQFYVFSKIGEIPFRYGYGLGAPFIAMVGHGRSVFTPETDIWINTYVGLFLACTVITLILSVREFVRSRNEVSISFLGFSIMPFVTSAKIWEGIWGYGRIFLPSAVLLILSFIKSKDNMYLLPLTLHVAMFFFVALW
jgi:hypothetical protein